MTETSPEHEAATVREEGTFLEARPRFRANAVLMYIATLSSEDGISLADTADALNAERRTNLIDLVEFHMGLGMTLDEVLAREPFKGLSRSFMREDFGDKAPDDVPEPYQRVWLFGKPYETTRHNGDDNARRFRENGIVRILSEREKGGRFNLRHLWQAHWDGPIMTPHFAAYFTMLGHSVDELLHLPFTDEVEIEEGELVRPDPAFVAESAELKVSMHDARRAMGIDSALADPVLLSTPLSEVEYGPLHAYMHRRFGFPNLGGDDYKDLSAGWLITTPHPGLLLKVRPSLSGPWHSFIPLMAPNHENSRERLPEDEALAARAAYRTALNDLLRLVVVRDNQINAMGEQADGCFEEYEETEEGEENEEADNEDLDEEEDRHLYSAPYHPSSGCSMPLGTFGNEVWGDLFGVANHFGQGDLVAGMTDLVRLGQARIMETAKAEPQNIQVLMLAGCFGPGGEKLREGLALPEDVERLAWDISAAIRRHGEISEGFVMPEYGDDEIERAKRLLLALGYGVHLKKPYKEYFYWLRMNREWAAFQDLAGGTFPAEALPKHGWASSKDAEALPGKLRDAGRPELAEWADRLLAEEDGVHVVAHILTMLPSWCEEQRKTAEAAIAADTTESGEA